MGAGGPKRRADEAMRSCLGAEAPSTGEGSAPKRLRTAVEGGAVDSEASLLGSVHGALEQAAEISCTSKEMLRRMSRACLCTPAEKRHEFQAAVADMFRGVFEGAVRTIRGDMDRARERSDATVIEKAARRRELGCTRAASAACVEAMREAKRLFSQDNLVLQRARERLDKAVEERRRVDSKWLEAGALHKALAVVRQEHFQPLMDGTDDAERHAGAVEKMLCRVAFEQSLVSAFSTAARKKPSARGNFDHLIFEQMRASFEKHAADLEALATSTPEGAVEREAEVRAAEEALAEARARQRASAFALREAEIAEWEAEGAVDAAVESVEAAEEALDTARTVAKDEERKLDDYLGGPYAAFEVLEGREGEAEEERAEISVALAAAEAAAAGRAPGGEAQADADATGPLQASTSFGASSGGDVCAGGVPVSTSPAL